MISSSYLLQKVSTDTVLIIFKYNYTCCMLPHVSMFISINNFNN